VARAVRPVPVALSRCAHSTTSVRGRAVFTSLGLMCEGDAADALGMLHGAHAHAGERGHSAELVRAN
jgi:hypothetical protein